MINPRKVRRSCDYILCTFQLPECPLGGIGPDNKLLFAPFPKLITLQLSNQTEISNHENFNKRKT